MTDIMKLRNRADRRLTDALNALLRLPVESHKEIQEVLALGAAFGPAFRDWVHCLDRDQLEALWAIAAAGYAEITVRQLTPSTMPSTSLRSGT